jgi:Rod binding domain-containing protein
MIVQAASHVPMSSFLTAQIEGLSDPHETDAQASEQMAVEFESVFVSLLLKEMRQTLNGDGLFQGDSSDSYGGLFDLYMGQHLAQAGGIGIGQLITQFLDADRAS